MLTFLQKLLAPPRLMVMLMLAVTWVRLWRFPHIPPAFNYDEAYNVIDSLWLWKSGAWLVFLPGNTGRHALFHYLAIPFLKIWGESNTFSIRFLSLVISLAVMPLMYRWVSTMFSKQADRYYLGLIAGAGLAFSFWHIILSRSGFRASLLLLLYVLMAYLFWQGWHRRSIRYIAGAGVALGLSQYTYWLALLLPLQFGLFAVIWTIVNSRRVKVNFDAPNNKQLWLWIGVMAASSCGVFIPLALTYINTPLVLQYVRQSSVVDRIANDPQATGASHLLTALRLYLDGPVALWQGNLWRALSFDWLVWLGFWVGLIVSMRRRRQPAYLFLLTGLFTLWLPAVLNDIDFSDLRLPDMLPVHHAISNLRVAGILPVYYAIVAVGLLSTAHWLASKFKIRKSEFIGLATFLFIVLVSGGLNAANVFIRWPQEPFLNERYNGPELKLAQDLLQAGQDKDILIPFSLYAHPTMRFVFNDTFRESDTPPVASARDSAILVTTDSAPLSAYMWLSGDVAYLTAPQDITQLLSFGADSPIETYKLAAPVFITAQTRLILNFEKLRSQLIRREIPNPVNYAWNDEVRLVGYQVAPAWARPGQAIQLTLYWKNLTDQPLTHDIFVHVINSRGEGMGQVDDLLMGDEFHQRQGKLSPTHYTIQLGDSLEPGPYLIRLGLFNTRTGLRLPIVGAEGNPIGDQVILGLFYVTEANHLPQPATQFEATLGEQIQLVGYTLPADQRIQVADNIVMSLESFWQALKPVGRNYTIFTQILDSNNQFVTGFDTQPLNGTYPTSLWQPGEIVNQRVNLTLPPNTPPGEYRLVTGMYEANTGARLKAIRNGELLKDNVVTLARLVVTSDRIEFFKEQK
jgi:hypothetical protein